MRHHNPHAAARSPSCCGFPGTAYRTDDAVSGQREFTVSGCGRSGRDNSSTPRR